MTISKLGAGLVLAPSLQVAPATKGTVPPAASPSAQTDSIKLSSSGTYTVQPGDTIGQVALKTHVSLVELKKANPEIFTNGKDAKGRLRQADGWWIYPGDVIKLAPGATSTTSPTGPTKAPTGISEQAIALAQAKKTIDGAAIAKPPADATKLPDWVATSSRTLQDAHGALDALKGAAVTKKLSLVDFTHYQQKVDGLDATFKSDLLGATTPTAPTRGRIPVDPPVHHGPLPAPVLRPVETNSQSISQAAALLEGATIAPLPKDPSQTADWYDQSRATLRSVHGALGTLYDGTTAGKVDDVTFNQYLTKGEHLVKFFDQQVDLMGGAASVQGGGAAVQWGGADAN